MDEALSRLLPSYKIGSDGFNWWIGQIEALSKDDPEVKGSFRYKVRIVGEHVKTCEIVGSNDLPWASVVMPVTAPMTVGGPVQGAPKLQIGNWVIGFYMDPDKQKPIIMGQMPQVMGSTGLINEFKPGECNSFTTYLDPRNNPYTDGPAKIAASTVESGEVPQTEPASSVTPEGSSKATQGETEAPKSAPPLRVIADLEQENICIQLADSCGKEKDLGWTFADLLGDMLAEIQSNNGNIGTALINRATGEISDGITDVTKYINQFIAVTELFLAKVKGIIKNGLKLGVDALIKAVLRQTDEGNALTPVTEFFNKQLKKLGCEMADIGERLAQFLTDLIMSYVDQIYRAAACQVDLLVSSVLNRIQSELNNLVSEILGFISNILGPIGDVLNIIGSTISKILSLLGITCGGGDKRCAKYKKECVHGDEDEEEEDEENFLDKLLSDLEDDIEGIAPGLGFDNTTYTCSDAYTGRPMGITGIGFIGGTPGIPGGQITPAPKIIYEIDDVKVTEGQVAKFTITRSGYTEITSSLNFRTSDDTAEAGSDYMKKEGLIVFEKGQVETTIEVFTLNDDDTEAGGEDFKLILTNATPGASNLATVAFKKNIGICTIFSADFSFPPGITSPDGVIPNNPFNPILGDPIKKIGEVFPPASDPEIIGDFDGDGETDDPNAILYQLLADKTAVKEGDFVVFTINTLNVVDGTTVPWIISGSNISTSDIVGGQLTGYAVIDNGTASVVVGIEEDAEIELAEIMTFTLSGKAISKNVTIVSQKDPDDFDLGVDDDDPSVVIVDPVNPIAGPPVTDPGGGIIEIPIKKPGGPYVIPPYVLIGGEGYGATAQALLNSNGFVTEIRVMNPGIGYRLNKPQDGGLRCIIDSFTMVRPGQGYTSAPTVWINNRKDIAEAVVEDGRVVTVRILDREITFDEYPEVLIIGGGGIGAKWIPSFACLDTPALAAVGSTKIGTGRYIDCP
ncbi:baseplate hub subunit and tail lysozyme [Synechococcus phage ACG-2014h]|uniref:Baseplate wedge initiator n=1 Tax=Synechococcus phage ACG-2014h TaxID=1340810 RepID=V5USW8_9CAUD|nr:baseplate hub subunit and tail lysozyme [Synechococcus phage ACG-2014h]AHB80425.1 baseplate wedge initiator [Synechococcus phage ACG-2014h]